MTLHMLKHSKGMTLVEVVVGACLTLVGLTALCALSYTSRFFIKRAENRERAMGLANYAMNVYMSKSYSDLGTLLPDAFRESPGFAISSSVNELYTDGLNIPYKQVNVKIDYNDPWVNNSQIGRQINLSNIMPYPYVHINTKSTAVAELCPNSSFGYITGLEISVNHKVAKDFIIYYDIAISIDDPSGIDELDIINTQCLIDSNPVGIITGTPIISEPSINNCVVVKNLAAGDHTIKFQWKKERLGGVGVPGGVIKLRQGSMTLVATESN